MVIGFSNERTSEYMILNDLYNKISNRCSFFYPFFFHKKRDDTSISFLNRVINLHLIACFARRPKTDYPLSDYSVISFRSSLFEQVNFLKKYEIPVIAGTPMGTGIEKIGFGSKCQWFELNAGVDEYYVEYKFINFIIDPKSVISGINLLDDRDLNNLLLSTPIYNWAEMLQLLQNWYDDYYNYRSHSLNMFYSLLDKNQFLLLLN